MASPSSIQGDLQVTGSGTFQRLSLPTGTSGGVSGDAIDPAAPVPVDKAVHRHRAVLAQDSGAAVAAQTRPAFRAAKAGTLERFAAGNVTAPVTGDLANTWDLLKNGVSVLASPVLIDFNEADRGEKLASIATPAYVAGDLFEVVVTVSGTTGTQCAGGYGTADFAE